MGMSSSQARLLNLTARMHQIEYKAAKLEAQKLQMANESSRVYEDYLRALDETKLQYKSINKDGSVTFIDATLAKLENGKISTYEGETSPTSFFLKDTKTGFTYISKDYATSIGVSSDSTPYLGSLEAWLWEKGAPRTDVNQPILVGQEDDLTKVISIASNGELPLPNDSTYTGFNNVKANGTTTFPNQLKSGETYVVNTKEDLVKLSQLSRSSSTAGVKIILNGDFDMSTTSFTSISNFQGEFDGNGHTISGLKTALFDSTNGAFISNLNLNNVNISASGNSAGTLVNKANNTRIANIKATGSINAGKNNDTGHNVVGGLIGEANNSNISLCTASVNVTGRDYIGGFIGSCNGTFITDCSSAGTVESLGHAGGFAGTIGDSGTTHSYITKCSSNCVIKTNADTLINNGASTNPDSGGFVGTIGGTDTTITYCKAEGSLTDTSTDRNTVIGGFLGCTSTSATVTISNCESSVNLTASKVQAVGFGSAYNGYRPNASNLNINNCNYLGNISSPSSICYDFAYESDTSPGTYENHVTSTNCYSSVHTSNGFTNGSGSNSSRNTYSSIGASSWTMPSASAVPATAINMSDLGSQQPSVPCNAALKSNIRAVLIKAGEYDPQGSVATDTTFDSRIATFLNSFYDNDADNSKLYAINALITNYLTNGGNQSEITALVEDIKAGKTKATATVMNCYTVMNQSTLNTIQRTGGTSWNPTYNPAAEQDYHIPDKATMKKNLTAVFMKFGWDTTNINSFVNKYTSEQDLAYLAKINDMLNTAVHSNSDAQLGDLKTKVLANQKYEPTGAVDVSKYSIVADINGNPRYEQQPVYEDNWVTVIDYSKEETKRLIEAYYAQKDGFIIVGDADDPGMDHSTEWLINMINTGTAILIEIATDEDGETVKLETSIATNTKLQEVAEEKELKKAEAKYEADMRRIDAKDKKYDTQLAALETERNATKQEMETLKTVANDNVDRTFKLFS